LELILRLGHDLETRLSIQMVKVESLVCVSQILYSSTIGFKRVLCTGCSVTLSLQGSGHWPIKGALGNYLNLIKPFRNHLNDLLTCSGENGDFPHSPQVEKRSREKRERARTTNCFIAFRHNSMILVRTLPSDSTPCRTRLV